MIKVTENGMNRLRLMNKTIRQFHINHICGVWENANTKLFDKPRHFTNPKHAYYLPRIQSIVTQIILCMLFLVCVSWIQHWNYRGHGSKTRNSQFIFLIYLRPWNTVKVIKPRMTMQTPSNIVLMQNLKDLALMVSEKKPTLKGFYFERRKYVSYLPWTCVKIIFFKV